MLNLCYDQLVLPTVGYPNLAKHQALPFTQEWREFDTHWPCVVPLRLTMYLDAAHIQYGVYTVAEAPAGSWYPVAFSWFDFSCDYFSMLSPILRSRIVKKEIKILFYYHEGDNPQRINQHLHLSLHNALLPKDCYYLISANTAADQIPQATYFSEHEFFFRYVNRKQRLLNSSTERQYNFTALNRTHKWWRAAVMSDLQFHNILKNSQWSYQFVHLNDDNYEANPIEVDIENNRWREYMHEFVNKGPYYCDELNKQKQNDHHYVNTDLYTNSYFQIIIETHFYADQSNGTFITEKTWKSIKYGQPFVVIGPAGTLAQLRDEGYCVFDNVLDNSYDKIKHNTERYVAIRKLLIDMQQQGIPELFNLCLDDVMHNQQMFESRTVAPLNTLLEKLQCQI